MKNLFLTLLWNIAPLRPFLRRRVPVHKRGYAHYWKSDEGKAYREKMYERQKDMDGNPTFEEMRLAIQKYSPESVLSVGCGYGREMIALAPYFPIEGCDIAEDLLAKVPPELHTFTFDLLTDTPAKQWDVVFCRAVLMYFTTDDAMRTVMKTLDRMAKKKVIVWEWPHICTAVHPFATEKFELHPIRYRDE